MEYGFSVISRILLATGIIFSGLSIEGVIGSVHIMQLPHGNRCILLHDTHTWHDERNSNQLDTVLEALKERGRTTERKLHVLLELVFDRAKWSSGHGVLCSLMEEVKVMNLDEEIVKNTVIEDIEIRKLYIAIVDMLKSPDLELYNEDARLTFDRELFCVRKDISFNDVLVEFEKQKKAAIENRDRLLELLDNEVVKDSISKDYNTVIASTAEGINCYQEFLRFFGIEPSSQEGVYQAVFSWEKRARDKFEYILGDIFNPFFDYNAFARVVSLCAENSNTDIVLLAGGAHCREVLFYLMYSCLFGEPIYNLVTDCKSGGIGGVPLKVLFDVLQEKTPVSSQVSNCVLL